MRASDPAPDATSAPLAEELHRLLSRSRRLLWIASARSLESRGDSVFTWQVLSYLVNHGPTLQQDLGLALAQDPAGMSRVLDELEQRRLVRRRADPDDRRRSLVELTAKGAAWHRSAAPAVAAAVEQPLRSLTAAQQRELCEILRALLSATGAPPTVGPRRCRSWPLQGR